MVFKSLNLSPTPKDDLRGLWGPISHHSLNTPLFLSSWSTRASKHLFYICSHNVPLVVSQINALLSSVFSLWPLSYRTLSLLQMFLKSLLYPLFVIVSVHTVSVHKCASIFIHGIYSYPIWANAIVKSCIS